MSFNLFVFERREHIKTSIDVHNFMEEFMQYKEDKDYNTLEGSSSAIVNWAEKMFEKFPQLNGKYTPTNPDIYNSDSMRLYLSDYSLGKHGVFCDFRSDVAEEALSYALSIADECGVGLYDPQNNELFGQNLEILKYRTESFTDTYADLEDIEDSIDSLDDISRGNSSRDNAFITIWFEKNKESEENFIQCMPIYEKASFLDSVFGKKKQNNISGYFFEIMKNDVLYQTSLNSKDELIILVKNWCIHRIEPDISTYQKILY